jgi:hypothetical protein
MKTAIELQNLLREIDTNIEIAIIEKMKSLGKEQIYFETVITDNDEYDESLNIQYTEKWSGESNTLFLKKIEILKDEYFTLILITGCCDESIRFENISLESKITLLEIIENNK